VTRRNDRAERVPEQRERVETERLGGEIHVPGEHVQGQARRLDPLAAPLAPLVDVEQPEVVRERIQPGPEVLMVEPRPAVQHEDRET